MALKTIPCVIMRGGTSKGVFFKEEVLPPPGPERDRVIVKIFGGGDPMQIDGLGGTHTHTSKTMIVSRSKKPGVDIDYTFGQVGIERAFIDWMGNCGNLTSAIAPFAIDEKIFEAKEPYTAVKMYNVNTKKRVDAMVSVENGSTKYEGDYMIDGVPNPGARIDNVWYEPGGAVSGKLLPTGNPIDKIDVDTELIEGSIVDAANPVVFIRARDVGLTGKELPHDITPTISEKLEKIRSKAAEMMGLVGDFKEATLKSPHFPFIVITGERDDYRTTGGKIVKKSESSVLARLFSIQKMHHAYAVTGAICTGAAAKIPRTIVNELCTSEGDVVVIGHPKGILDVKVAVDQSGEITNIKSVTVGRTARRLMAGVAYYTH